MTRWTVFTLCIAVAVLAPLAACSGQAPSDPEMVENAPPPPAGGQMAAPPPPPKRAPKVQRIAEEQQAIPVPKRQEPPPTMTVTIPDGTQMTVAFDQALNSGTAVVGDAVSVRLGSPLIAADRVVFPAGSRIDGKVTGVKPATKGFKDTGGAIAVSFDRIVGPEGRSANIVAGFTKLAEGSGQKKGVIIGGSAAGGAVLGKVLGKDTAGSALIGGAIGTAIAGATKGKEAVLEGGEQITVALEQSIRVTVKR